MEIKLKRVPFNIELAKKITDGKIKGAKIIDGLNRSVRILNFNLKGKFPIAAVISLEDITEAVYCFTNNGTFNEYTNDEKNLQILVPVHYNDYSNFVPQKWQPCLVRNLTDLPWIIRVATGEYTESNKPYFFDSLPDLKGIERHDYYLPLSKLTIKLLGSRKSYEQLLEEQWTSEE